VNLPSRANAAFMVLSRPYPLADHAALELGEWHP